MKSNILHHISQIYLLWWIPTSLTIFWHALYFLKKDKDIRTFAFSYGHFNVALTFTQRFYKKAKEVSHMKNQKNKYTFLFIKDTFRRDCDWAWIFVGSHEQIKNMSEIQLTLISKTILEKFLLLLKIFWKIMNKTVFFHQCFLLSLYRVIRLKCT